MFLSAKGCLETRRTLLPLLQNQIQTKEARNYFLHERSEEASEMKTKKKRGPVIKTDWLVSADGCIRYLGPYDSKKDAISMLDLKKIHGSIDYRVIERKWRVI